MEPLCDLIERHRNKLLAIFKRDGCLRFTGKHALEIVPRIDRIDQAFRQNQGLRLQMPLFVISFQCSECRDRMLDRALVDAIACSYPAVYAEAVRRNEQQFVFLCLVRERLRIRFERLDPQIERTIGLDVFVAKLGRAHE